MTNRDENETDFSLENSLLKEYEIPITHLDFDYVEKCQDGEELEKIFHILKSGQEGHYPDLTRVTEEKLRVFMPKSRFLRYRTRVREKKDLNKEELDFLTEEMDEWVQKVAKDNRELEFKKKTTKSNENNNLPRIRQTKTILDVEKPTKNNKNARIKSTDYVSWEKYDPDTEILKMDLENEKEKKEASATQKNKQKTRKEIKFNEFPTEIEANYAADKEREKGNEYFKQGEYESALYHYDESLNYKKTLRCLNNRAMTFLKLDRNSEALLDCESALALDPDNFRASFRKAQALEKLERFEEGLTAVETCVKLEPNNKTVQELAGKLRKKSGLTNEKEKRYAIEEFSCKLEEVTEKTEKKEEDDIEKKGPPSRILIPIPGTSTMPEPYYVICDPEHAHETLLEINRTQNQTTFMTLLSNDERDDCSAISTAVDVIKSLNNVSDDEEENSSSSTDKNGEINEKDEKKLERNIRGISSGLSKDEISDDDREAGGEPHKLDGATSVPEDLNLPYTFLKTWTTIGNDPTCKKYARILKNLNVEQIGRVIGCKMDSEMLSTILKTACLHFTVPGEVETIRSVLTNLATLPRFEIVSMLMSSEDRNNLKILIAFLDQHDKSLPENVKKRFMVT